MSAFIFKAEVLLILTLFYFKRSQTLQLCTAGTLLHWDQRSTTLQTFFALPEMYFTAPKCSTLKYWYWKKLCLQIRVQEPCNWNSKTLNNTDIAGLMFRPDSGGAVTDGVSVVFQWKNPITGYIICTDREYRLSMHIWSKTRQSCIHKDKQLLQMGGIRCDIFCLVMWELLCF